MKAVRDNRGDGRSISLQQQRFQREEFRACLRALLMTPLMSPAHDDFAAVRRQAEALREWFSRETGWPLQVEREGARLFKYPGTVSDATRGLPGYDRRRYVLLCLACAALERADPQITLRLLGERLLELAAEPGLDFTFTLEAQHERRELVWVCRTLLGLGVLHRVAGDEETFVQARGEQADALYDVQRRMLAGMLAAVRGPSTWIPQEAPATLEERLRALVDGHVADSEEGRRTALRHQLARRLLDDPVVYIETLDPEVRAYFLNQRGTMAARLGDAAGLVAEQRAEGLALVDETGFLTDVAMPAEGTDAHVTLLVAEHLAAGQRQRKSNGAELAPVPVRGFREHDIADFLREARTRYGRYWRKSAREPGAERELAAIAIERLEKLQLALLKDGTVYPLPALARFALGEAQIRETRDVPAVAVGPLFGLT
ncbi:TIGR02678 family protein [Mesorhizobium sp. VK25A]|uniref:TIGR02678 family protein n=1 Tax=Mesorhizobium vachelliae TaxID=3072309 RepID=A0ABU5AES1_9HYPH|nr:MULTISPECIES: TIGR02678 family protein [unclassified Mesorhizobium]MDX8535793.1 TIGR02678 family protein [Mesorhizobium sp. VK25D]MDX8548542.1 TIGR02678 family protein [Mesorhizobium sp. VK25A]